VDETGWRVGGRSQWLWAAVSELVTVYCILPGRGSAQLKQILGADYDAWLLHDGLRCYSSLHQAAHQTCLTHLIRRCQEMAERAPRAAAQFPLQVKTLLQQALSLSHRYAREELTLHGLAVATGRLESGHGTLAGSRLPHGQQSATGQASEPPAGIPVHVSTLSGSGRDQQSRGAGHPAGGDRAQGVGWQTAPGPEPTYSRS